MIVGSVKEECFMKWDDYFEKCVMKKQELAELPLCEHTCEDCPVVLGFFSEYSKGLKTQNNEVQQFISKRWNCHTFKKKACRGNAEYLGITW